LVDFDQGYFSFYLNRVHLKGKGNILMDKNKKICIFATEKQNIYKFR